MAMAETEDPRMNEIYMKDNACEKMSQELTRVETLFAKIKDGIFYYPKALHPMAVASKELTQSIEQLFPRECPYAGVTTIFSTAFAGLVAVYNDTVKNGKDAVTSANKWFETVKKTKDLFVMREKYKKEYDHYLKKTVKMRADREVKKAKNPANIETAKDVEWHLRNDRKLETARSNLITVSQQSYTSAKECIKLRYEYMMPILDTFSKNLTKFFNGTNNAVVNLPEVKGQIEKGRQAQQEKDAEEKIRELRLEEEKLRKLQEVRDQIAKEKRERELKEQEKLQRELQEKQREILAKYSPHSSQGAESPPYRRQDSSHSGTNPEDEYLQPQDQDTGTSFRVVASRQARPTGPFANYYPTADSSYSPRPPEVSFYSQPVPRTNSYYGGQPRTQGSFYEQPRPEPEYYDAPRPRGNYYRQPQPNAEYMSGGYNESYATSSSYQQRPRFTQLPSDWNAEQAPLPNRSSYQPHSTQDPFEIAFSQPQPTYQEPGGIRRPRNPFTTGAYAQPAARPQNDQYEFLGL